MNILNNSSCLISLFAVNVLLSKKLKQKLVIDNEVLKAVKDPSLKALTLKALESSKKKLDMQTDDSDEFDIPDDQDIDIDYVDKIKEDLTLFIVNETLTLDDYIIDSNSSIGKQLIKFREFMTDAIQDADTRPVVIEIVKGSVEKFFATKLPGDKIEISVNKFIDTIYEYLVDRLGQVFMLVDKHKDKSGTKFIQKIGDELWDIFI